MTFKQLWRRDKWAMLTGALLGLAISGYALVYAPMRSNFGHCGKVTLCIAPNEAEPK